jgi:hypothetical protein
VPGGGARSGDARPDGGRVRGHGAGPRRGPAPARPQDRDAERLADELRAYAREGVSHVQLWLEPNTLESLEAFAPVLALLDRSPR